MFAVDGEGEARLVSIACSELLWRDMPGGPYGCWGIAWWN